MPHRCNGVSRGGLAKIRYNSPRNTPEEVHLLSRTHLEPSASTNRQALSVNKPNSNFFGRARRLSNLDTKHTAALHSQPSDEPSEQPLRLRLHLSAHIGRQVVAAFA